MNVSLGLRDSCVLSLHLCSLTCTLIPLRPPRATQSPTDTTLANHPASSPYTSRHHWSHPHQRPTHKGQLSNTRSRGSTGGDFAPLVGSSEFEAFEQSKAVTHCALLRRAAKGRDILSEDQEELDCFTWTPCSLARPAQDEPLRRAEVDLHDYTAKPEASSRTRHTARLDKEHIYTPANEERHLLHIHPALPHNQHLADPGAQARVQPRRALGNRYRDLCILRRRR